MSVRKNNQPTYAHRKVLNRPRVRANSPVLVLLTPCPTCDAPASEPCVATLSSPLPREDVFHKTRRTATRRAV